MTWSWSVDHQYTAPAPAPHGSARPRSRSHPAPLDWCISHAFDIAACRNPDRLAVIHSSASDGDGEERHFTCGDLLAVVASLSYLSHLQFGFPATQSRPSTCCSSEATDRFAPRRSRRRWAAGGGGVGAGRRRRQREVGAAAVAGAVDRGSACSQRSKIWGGEGEDDVAG
jgi:hypothetical protein